MIQCCILNNLIITNTFYQHKEKQIYTLAPTSQEKSIIDYFLVEKIYIYKEIHYAVVAVMNKENINQAGRDNIKIHM